MEVEHCPTTWSQVLAGEPPIRSEAQWPFLFSIISELDVSLKSSVSEELNKKL